MFSKRFDTFAQWLYSSYTVIVQVRMAGAVVWPEKQRLCSFEDGAACSFFLLHSNISLETLTVRVLWRDFRTLQNVIRNQETLFRNTG